MKRLATYFLYLFLVLACKQEQIPEEPKIPVAPAISLEKLSPDQTGVHFNNVLHDEGNLNVFVWNFLYTGGGVATGDINNDGLPDIYFAGNQVPDRLYLNKGNFTFEDISESAGIPNDKTWSTGVTMADVNADGLLDIYVCKNSPTPNRDANRNRLLINLGDGRFAEQAGQYGLADEGFSIQAMFFDSDQDGDLDMFLVNQPFDQFARYIHPREVVQEYPVTDRFFINNGGHFTDQSVVMHVTDDRYGLGISLGDFDDNGWTDIYLCNDYQQADFLYMNYNGMFVDELRERTGHISLASMGSDAGDVNNDGWEDVFVLDMAYDDNYRAKTNMEAMRPEVFWDVVAQGHHYQYAQNTLQLNRGDGFFTEVAQIGGLAKTDWSWSTLLADLDQDGMQDVIVTNGILRDMKDNDFTKWVKLTYQGRVGPGNYKDVLSHLPSNPVPNRIFRNIDGFRYQDVTDQSGFGGTSLSHGLSYADFDGDGALDLVMNNMNAPAGIYRNNSKSRGNYFVLMLDGPGQNKNGLGVPVILFANGKRMARTMQTTRGYYSSSVPELHFGLGNAGKIDSLIVEWNAKEMTVLHDLNVNQKLVVTYSTSKKVERTRRISNNIVLGKATELLPKQQEIVYDDYKDQWLLPYKLSQNGPLIARSHSNGQEGDMLYIGGSAGNAGTLLRMTKDGAFHKTDQPAFGTDASYEDQGAVFFDIDGDQDEDLYVVSGSSEFAENDPLLEDRVYLNDGSGVFIRSQDVLPDNLRINGQCVECIDLDGDNDLDVFIGGRVLSGKYPLPASSAILVNDNGVLRDRTNFIAPFLRNFGLVTSAVSDDIDGDGDADLLVVGEWMSPALLINDGGKFSVQTLDDPGTGIWWAVAKADIDNDGDSDFILGNLGWNQPYGGEHPNLAVYAGDLDKNGDHDVILTNTENELEVPYRGLESSAKEMPFISTRFPTYDGFAKAHLTDIVSRDQLDKNYHARIHTLSSVALRNEGQLKFSVIVLPEQVQTGPVKAISCGDFNGDGNQDFIYVGNHFPVEVETARYDGLLQGICLGDGNGGFRQRTFSCPDAPLTGDYRDIVTYGSPESGFRLILTQNNGPVETYDLGIVNNREGF